VPDERRLTILFATGLKINVTTRELFDIMVDPIVVSYFLVVGVSFAYVVPQEGHHLLGGYSYFFAALLLSAFVLVVLHAAFAVFILISYNIPSISIVTSIVLLFVALSAELGWQTVFTFFTDLPFPHDEAFWRGFGTKTLGVIAGELVYASFILQRTRWWQSSEYAQESTTLGPAQEALANHVSEQIDDETDAGVPSVGIVIGKKSVSLGSILYAQAERQYVRVFLSDTILFERMTFASFLESLPSGAGVRVHRSYWISFSAVDALETGTDGREQIVLKNGVRVPVSRRFGKNLTYLRKN